MKKLEEDKGKICTCLNCGKYCSNTCQQEYQHKQKYQDSLLHPENYARAPHFHNS